MDGAAEVQPQRRGLLLVGLGILGAVALFLLPSTNEMIVRLRGEGYVHWHSVRWQAVQAAVTHQKPLVVLRYHPKDAEVKRRLAKEILAEPELQQISERFIWLVEKGGGIGEPPTLEVRFLDDATLLAGPWKASEVEARRLLIDLREVLEENERLTDESLRGS